MTGTGEAVAFWIVAILMVIGALGLVFLRRTVFAALCMVFVMVLQGVLYLTMRADFVGLAQIFVYTGAVMMMFLFVVMIVGVDASEAPSDTLPGQKWIALVLGAGLAIIMGVPLVGVMLPLEPSQAEAGGVTGIALSLFSTYLLAFELIGVLLTIAGVAALVLAHRERLLPRRHQRDYAAQRVKDNHYVAGLPGPGVYARHNAADVPALLPDGSQSELSVSRVLDARGQRISPDEFVEAADATGREIEEGEGR